MDTDDDKTWDPRHYMVPLKRLLNVHIHVNKPYKNILDKDVAMKGKPKETCNLGLPR
jgi:hypothetical protein